MAQNQRPLAETLSGSPQPNFVGYQPSPIISKRNPTAQDRGYPLGQVWDNKILNMVWTLSSVAAGLAVWILMGSVSAGVSTLSVEGGAPILPVGGNFDFSGFAPGGAITFSSAGAGLINAAVNVDGVTITVVGNQLVAAAALMIQFDPDTGGNVSPVANVITIPGLGGNETLNGGAGIFQIENRRWLSAFVVDPSVVVGSRGTFTTIQAAITAAAAAGGATVYVRPGTYVENLTLQPGVNLVGATGSSGIVQVPAISNSVVVTGNHTLGTGGTVEIDNMRFNVAAGTNFTLNNAAGFSVILMNNCGVDSSAGVGSAFSIGAGAAGNAVGFFNSEAISNTGTTFVAAGSGSFLIRNSVIDSQGSGINYSSSSSGGEVVNTSFLAVNDAIIIGSAVGSLNVRNCNLRSDTGVNFTAAGTFIGNGNRWDCSSVSTNYIAGAAGTYEYVNDQIAGSATNIAGTISQVREQWRPRGTQGTSVTAYAGTASFDQDYFTVTDGFVTQGGGSTGTVTTVGAVTLPLLTIPMGAVAGTRQFDILISGFDAATPSGAGYAMIASARTTGVAAAECGTEDTTENEDPAFFPADVFFAAVGNNVVVSVLGVAGLTINWRGLARSVFVS